MDVSQVQQLVRAIADTAHDPEVAHTREDDLFVSVLESIAVESTDGRARDLADAALEARKIQFERWLS